MATNLSFSKACLSRWFCCSLEVHQLHQVPLSGATSARKPCFFSAWDAGGLDNPLLKGQIDSYFTWFSWFCNHVCKGFPFSTERPADTQDHKRLRNNELSEACCCLGGFWWFRDYVPWNQQLGRVNRPSQNERILSQPSIFRCEVSMLPGGFKHSLCSPRSLGRWSK